jgi:hypothetical protein
MTPPGSVHEESLGIRMLHGAGLAAGLTVFRLLAGLGTGSSMLQILVGLAAVALGGGVAGAVYCATDGLRATGALDGRWRMS